MNVHKLRPQDAKLPTNGFRFSACNIVALLKFTHIRKALNLIMAVFSVICCVKKHLKNDVPFYVFFFFSLLQTEHIEVILVSQINICKRLYS